jgi:hypothetical protein
MIRKAEKQGYEFREFDWNGYLEDIYDINTSKEVRTSGVMHGWYREPVKPRHHSPAELYYRKYYGAFREGRLKAYLNLVLCGDFGFFKHFIGHASDLTNGIMNGLISWTVREYLGHPHVRWLSYGSLPTRLEAGSGVDFKRHAGFEGYVTFFDLNDNRELLRFSKAMRAVCWPYR